jgi:peptide/nickel transport system ATP-binding protein
MQADREPDVLLDIRDLRTTFFTDAGEVKAVDGVSLTVRRGRTTCIVGESGSGKSATARSILQLVDTPGRIVGGEILLHPASGGDAIDLASLDPRGASLRAIRGKDIGMIFQEPMSSLSPVHTIGNQIAEVLTVHEGRHAKDVRKRVIAELGLVGIPEPAERCDSYTFQLSGGMRQRAMIAMALITRPQLLIADEPTTALDVTTQAQILDLLRERKDSSGMSLLFITHDLGVVAEIADDVVVMRNGKVVETGSVDEIFHAPQHPYTRSLLASLPQRGVATLHRAPVVSAARDAGQPMLEVDALTMEFHTRSGKRFSGKTKSTLVAVDGVSLSVYPGQTLGLVGESGCGKTTLGRAILRAYKPTSGRLLYRPDGGEAVDLAPLSQRALLPYRRDIRMVFQDPYGSLNPQMTVQQIVTEPLRAAGVRGAELHDRAATMMTRVGLRTDYLARYPHAFSGGERQRIGIARALITSPKLVVADEAVSALDVSIRTQVLELLAQLQAELGLTYIFISHDLSVIERICDEVAVMYFGRIVERGSASDVFLNPQHGYTQSLLSAVPIADPAERGMRQRFSYRPDDAAEMDRLAEGVA